MKVILVLEVERVDGPPKGLGVVKGQLLADVVGNHVEIAGTTYEIVDGHAQ